jgi:hypothetical protein
MRYDKVNVRKISHFLETPLQGMHLELSALRLLYNIKFAY